MKNLTKILEACNQLKVLVVGDVMLDTYLWGTSTRISPEAPVPVVDIRETESRLGGAANVALNISALGAIPTLVSVIGQEDTAATFLQLCQDFQLDTHPLLQVENRPTTEKTRIFGGHQQMIRFDKETTADISGQEAETLLHKIAQVLQAGNINVIILQDYNKGVLTPDIIRGVIAIAREHNVPVAVDPKKLNVWEYQQVDLFKPNLKEVSELLGIAIQADDLTQLKAADDELRERLQHRYTLITLGNKGIYLSGPDEVHHIPATVRNVADVSGAGDTVIAVAALALAAGADLKTAATLANLAGGLVCEYAGVVPVPKGRLINEAAKWQTSTN